MLNLLEQTPEQLQAWLTLHGAASFRGEQIRHWLFDRRAGDFDQMTELPKALRAALNSEFRIFSSRVLTRTRAADGTEKLLLELADGNRIECVLICQGARRTACVSTQVGCAMGCVFCASGLDGVERNLATGEILEQLLLLGRLLADDDRLSHVVVMGMGEPLANLGNLLPALSMVTSPTGLGISARRITVSTVGLPQGIDRLIAENRQYHLAVSLHAPDDELRNRLVPVNRKTGLQPVLAAADRYFEMAHRRLTFEYVLLGGINDQPQHARQLAELLHGRTALLNLISYNPVAGLGYRSPSAESIQRFLELLRQASVNVQLRQRKGDEIDAACGQLRRSFPAAAPQTGAAS